MKSVSRNTTRVLFSFLLIVVTNLWVNAQYFNSATYPFTISSGTILENMTGAPNVVFQTGADTSDLIAFPSGFKFWFAGEVYDSFSVSKDIFIRLGKVAKNAAIDDLADSSNYPILAPLWNPFWSDGFGSDDFISYKLFGVAPYRKCVVHFYEDNYTAFSQNTNYTVQLWLFESTGKFEFVYGGNPSFTGFGNGGFSCGYANRFVEIDAFGSIITPSNISYTTANGANASSFSSGKRFSFIPDTLTPNTPLDLVFSSVGAACQTLNWIDNSSSEIFFEIYRSTDGINYDEIRDIYSSTSSATGINYSYQDTILQPSTMYYYKIIAKNFARSSPDTLEGNSATVAPSLSGIKTIPGDYASIYEAIEEIKCKQLSGPLILELQANYNSSAEVFPLTFDHRINSDSNKTVTIRPSATANDLEINTAVVGSIVVMNRTQYIKIDGRPGGTGNSKELKIKNSGTAVANASVLKLINGAHHITIKNCDLEGNTPSNSSGTIAAIIMILGTDTTMGNSFNLIKNCNIHSGSALVNYCIYALGNVVHPNLENEIIGNNIYNYGKNNFYGSATGIHVLAGNSEWSIEENSFYQTTLRDLGSFSNTLTDIFIGNTAGNNFKILNNYFGGTGPQLTGGFSSFTSSSLEQSYYGIWLKVGNASWTVVDGNSFNKINTGPTSDEFIFIQVDSGKVKIGDVQGNRIGSIDSLYGIIQNCFCSCIGTWYNADSIIVRNNQITGIQSNYSITCIDFRNGMYGLIENNIIGSDSVDESILSTSYYGFKGIRFFNSITNLTVRNNIVSHIKKISTTNNYQNTMIGIDLGNALTIPGDLLLTVENNTVSYLENVEDNEMVGIKVETHNGGQIITGNSVHHLSLLDPDPGNSGEVFGIYSRTIDVTEVSNVISHNFIHTLISTGSWLGGLYGIYSISEKAHISNNMVQLGRDQNGNSIKYDITCIGIAVREDGDSGQNKIFNNTIVITGDSLPIHATSFGISVGYYDQDSIFNNIIDIKRTFFPFTGIGGHNCFDLYGYLSDTIYSDYNLFLISDVISFTDTMLAQWQISSGQDLHSIEQDPMLVSAEGAPETIDLHLQLGSPAESTGTPLTSVTDDIDYQERALYSPSDIGADAGHYSLTSCIIGLPEINNVSTSNCSITVSWDSVPTASYYGIRIKPLSGGSWSPLQNTGQSLSYTFNNLLDLTSYRIRIGAYCPNNLNSGWESDTVITTACPYPSSSSVNILNSNTVKVLWSAVCGANSYSIRYRISGNPWITKQAQSNSKKLQNLVPNSTYFYQVKTNCSVSSSGYFPVQTFTTPLRMEGEGEEETFICYPNPTDQLLFISGVLNESGLITYDLYNQLGQIVSTESDRVDQGNFSKKISLPDTEGVYFLVIRNNEEVKYSQRIIKM